MKKSYVYACSTYIYVCTTCMPDALQTHWIFETKIIYPISISPSFTPTPPMSPHLSLKFMISSSLISIVTYMCIFIHNLLNPFGVAPVYMHLGLTTWDAVTSQGAHSWRKLILPVSAVIDYLVRLSLPVSMSSHSVGLV